MNGYTEGLQAFRNHLKDYGKILTITESTGSHDEAYVQDFNRAITDMTTLMDLSVGLTYTVSGTDLGGKAVVIETAELQALYLHTDPMKVVFLDIKSGEAYAFSVGCFRAIQNG